MSKLRKNYIFSIIAAALFMLIVFVLQSMVFSRILILGVRPLLLPIAVVSYALLTDEMKGAVFGLAAGILCDVSMNSPAILFTLLLTACGLIVGRAAQTLVVRNVFTFMIGCAAVLVLCAGAQMFSLVMLQGVPVPRLMPTALRQTLASLIFSLPIYYFNRLVSAVSGFERGYNG